MTSAVIVDYARTPFTRAATEKRPGVMANIYPNDLEAMLARTLIQRTGIDPHAFEAVLTGCAFPSGRTGLNDARNVVLHPESGLPDSVAGVTMNQFCASSLQAVISASNAIVAGNGEAFLCTGIENMSLNPTMAGFDKMNPAIVASRKGFLDMSETAERLATTHNIRRKAQDAFALASHERTAAAQDAGFFASEIVPVSDTITADEWPRRDTSMETLAKLRPIFSNGSVTAGSSSPLTDGATAMIVTSEAFAKANDLPIRARIISAASHGCDPAIMGIGPVRSSKKAMDRAGMSLDKIGVIELNEAFAAQSLAVIHDMGLEGRMQDINQFGGAISLGHPLGASGIRIAGAAVNVMERKEKDNALVTMCVGGGQGVSMVIERYRP